MFYNISRSKDHPIWKHDDAQAVLANAALFAALAYKIKETDLKPLQIFKAVALYASKELECDEYQAKLDGESEARSIRENFRRFIHHETATMQDATFLDCLAAFLLRPAQCESYSRGHGHPVRSLDNGDEIWSRYLKTISGQYDIQRAFTAFQDGSFDSTPFAYHVYDPGADLNRIAETFFKVTDKQFSAAALALTGHEKLRTKATWLEKGYWSCYRLSGSKCGYVVKTRLIVTPPEPGYQYCRFENISKQDISGNRDARGLVLPVGRKLYFIGTFNSDGIGTKVISLAAPMQNASVTSGLVMSTGIGNDRSVVSRIVAKREEPRDVVEDLGDGYRFKRGDLDRFSLDVDLKKLLNIENEPRSEDMELARYIKSNVLNFDEDCLLGVASEARSKFCKAVTEIEHGS